VILSLVSVIVHITLRLTGWQRSEAELTVRVEPIVSDFYIISTGYISEYSLFRWRTF
jgi:hypothetical protein